MGGHPYIEPVPLDGAASVMDNPVVRIPFRVGPGDCGAEGVGFRCCQSPCRSSCPIRCDPIGCITWGLPTANLAVAIVRELDRQSCGGGCGGRFNRCWCHGNRKWRLTWLWRAFALVLRQRCRSACNRKRGIRWSRWDRILFCLRQRSTPTRFPSAQGEIPCTARLFKELGISVALETP